MNKLSLFFCILLASCTPGTQETQTTPPPADESVVTLTDAQLKNAKIVTGKPETRELHALLKVNGVIDIPPMNLVSVSFPMGGYLKSTELLPGMKVTKGQALAVMEDASYITLQQDYLVGVARLEQLKKDFERQQQLNASKSTSDKVFEQAGADYSAQQATVNALRQKLLLIGITPDKLTAENISRTVTIRAPIGGYVSAVNVNPGKYVNPTDVLFELVNPSDLHIALTVFEKDLGSVQPGQRVNVSSPRDPSNVYEAEVLLVARKLDDDRSAVVHCHFKNGHGDFLPGMFVNAEIEVARTGACAVPSDAVVRSGENEYVFVEAGPGTFIMTGVKTGISESGWTELLPGEDGLCDHVMITKNAWSALMKLQNKSEE